MLKIFAILKPQYFEYFKLQFYQLLNYHFPAVLTTKYFEYCLVDNLIPERHIVILRMLPDRYG